MLVLLITKINDEMFSRKTLLIIVVLEFAVAVLNTVLPMSTITEDIQSTDTLMNYLALYMRPVIFSSVALVYRVWLDLQKTREEE